jgi:hypothetical protein
LKSIINSNNNHYNIYNEVTMEDIRQIFPEGRANKLNLILFSTSGIHGSYTTIEDVEKDRGLGLTVLIFQPRRVCMIYGVLYDLSDSDIEYLKRLRESNTVEIASEKKEG